MSSGTSAFGGTGRCYRFWLGFSECRENAGSPNLCLLERADYLECLHRDKLIFALYGYECTVCLRVCVQKRRIASKALALQGQSSPKPESHGHH